MMQHDDETQDTEMIKSVLQKIIDEMNGLEADRIMPDHKKPGYSTGSDGIPHPAENSAETPMEAEPENQDNQHEELDPEITRQLMEKATSADDQGSLPEDVEHEFPQEIQVAINARRKRDMRNMPKG